MPKKKIFDMNRPLAETGVMQALRENSPPESTHPTKATPSKHNAKTKGRSLNIDSSASLEAPQRSFLNLVQQSNFYSENRLEPRIGSPEADALFGQEDAIKTFIKARSKGRSIYTLLIDKPSYTCQLCKSRKGSLVRALSCVRSHLDHRPFRCPGAQSDYPLRDHLTSQTHKFKCIHEDCLRRGNMVRHWKTMHKETPFPLHMYPGYHIGDEVSTP